MAWIYLAVSEGSQLPYEIGSAQPPIAKTTNTLKPFCFREWRAGNFQAPRYGMMCELSAATKCFCQSTSSTAASPARTLALRELERAWAESEVDFSSTSQGLSAKQTRDLYFSKTSQQLELVASTVSAKHLPSSGMIVAGQLYQPQKLVPRTCGKGGSCLPTPAANSYGTNQGGAAGRTGKVRASLETMARKNLWPTPRTTGLDGGSHSRKAAKARGMWPTPCARDHRSGMSPENLERRKQHSRGVNLAEQMQRVEGVGQLNPTWVEWLMGYPLEWTALEDWATQWFRSKRKSRSSGSRDSEVSA